MEKLSIQNKFSLILSILSIIISLFSLLFFYVDHEQRRRDYLSVAVYGDNHKEYVLNGYPDTARFDSIRHTKGEREYLIAVKPDYKKSVAWFYGYNGPEKLKRDATNKFFVIGKLSEFSVCGSLINELNYAWFKLWH